MPVIRWSTACLASAVSAITCERSATRSRLISERSSPIARTLGSQLVAMSTVFALIDRMLVTARTPSPHIVTSMKAMTDMIFVRMDSLDTGDPGWLCGSHRSLPTLDTETDPCVCAALHSASIRAEKDRSPIGTIWGKTSQTSVKLTARTNTERSHRPCAAGGHKGVDGPTAQCCWRPDAAGRRDTSAGFIGMPGLLKASYYHCMYFVQHRAKGVGRHDGPVSPMPAQVRR